MAFLAVGLADAVHHHDAGSHAAVFVSNDDAGSADDTAPGKAANTVEHCHACTMLAVLIDLPLLPHIPAIADRQAPAPDGVTPHPPIIETPPPIVAI